MTETVVKHKALRLCTDAANALWDKISFWTHASDVEFDDGSTAADLKDDVNELSEKVDSIISGTQTKSVVPSNVAQTVVPDTGYSFLSEVDVAAIPYTEVDNPAGGKTVTIGAPVSSE